MDNVTQTPLALFAVIDDVTPIWTLDRGVLQYVDEQRVDTT